MRYAGILIIALMLGPALEAVAGFDGGNAPGGGRVQGKWYNPAPQGCCTADADVKAIELGLESDEPDVVDAANDALRKQLKGQVE